MEGVASHITFSGVPPPVVPIVPIKEVILMITLSPQPFVDRDTEQEAWLYKNKKDIGH